MVFWQKEFAMHGHEVWKDLVSEELTKTNSRELLDTARMPDLIFLTMGLGERYYTWKWENTILFLSTFTKVRSVGIMSNYVWCAWNIRKIVSDGREGIVIC